jgi:multidrug efflux system membrane fusion protein
LARYQALMKQNAIAEQQVATQEALVKSDDGIVVADQANVETARINLGYTNIVSPVDGRAGIHLVDIGNVVTAGQSNGIVVVTTLQPMSVLFTIPEDNINQVMARLSTGATLPADAYDRAQVAKIASGTLSAVDSVVDPTTGSVKLRALFDNKDNKLFPDQFVNIRLLVDTLHHQTVVPVAAIQRGADGSFVFAVTPEKTVNQRDVTTGVQDGNNIQILSGVAPNDTVVVDGADRLRDGADVEIPNQVIKIAAPAGAAADDAVRAARRAQMAAALNKACSEDVKKYCPTSQPGREVRVCLSQNRDSLSDDCSKVVSQMRRGFAGGGRQGGGGGGGGGTP